MQRAPTPFLLIDLDRCGSLVSQNEKRCDYLFIGGSGDIFVAPLELKRGKVDASEVVSQLRAGARITKKVVPKGLHVLFRPIVAHRGMHKAQRDELRKKVNAVAFRASKELVRLIECGDPLTQGLRQA